MSVVDWSNQETDSDEARNAELGVFIEGWRE